MLSSRPRPVVPTNGARPGALGRSSHRRHTANGLVTVWAAMRARHGGSPRAGEAATICWRPGMWAARTRASAVIVRLSRRTGEGEAAVGGAGDVLERGAEADGGAEQLEVVLHGLPQAGRERAVEDVEDDALGVPEEVEVEHHHQLGGAELVLGVEEGVGEHIEEHLAGARREAEAVEELARGQVVVAWRRWRRGRRPSSPGRGCCRPAWRRAGSSSTSGGRGRRG
jgi:hypothetical protein